LGLNSPPRDMTRKAPLTDMSPVCFPPLASSSSTVLILGSFPGRLSLEKRQYYAHPRNSFWPIMGRLFGFDPLLPYSQRAELLRRNNIALWDVLSSCSRSGSLDASIEKKSIRINDFETFFVAHPHIDSIFFNGVLAETQFVKNVLSKPEIKPRSFVLFRLPSTSPAMAMLNFEEKFEVWKIISACVAGNDSHETPKAKK
jgi:TDG/mug DNA glycosylase family protein